MADSANPVTTVDILGFPVATAGLVAIDGWLRSVLLSDERNCRHVVTLNPEYVMAARRNPQFAAALREADLATADGVGIVLAARAMHGIAIPRITGVELVERLAALSAETQAGLFLLGAAPGVADQAAAQLSERIPGFAVAGTWAEGSPKPADDDETLRRIEASGAAAVLVAYGAPAQVLWIARNHEALAQRGARLAIGVGGSFDYLSGSVARPPGWLRRLGLEWLFRLVREPWRWRRQTVLPLFAARVAIAAIQGRLRLLHNRPER